MRRAVAAAGVYQGLVVEKSARVARKRGKPDVHLTIVIMMRCKRGGSAAEYALLLGLIATVLVGSMTLLGTAINARYESVSTQLTP